MNAGWVEITALFIGAVGGVTGVVSAFISWWQWKKTTRKLCMLEQSGAAFEVLPAWYTRRMMDDHWLFGLQTNDGKVIVIRKITAVSSDGRWMDVELAEKEDVEHLENNRGEFIFAIAPDRTDASIGISNIVAAYDLVTS